MATQSQPEGSSVQHRLVAVVLTALILVGLALRTVKIGGTFASGDAAELPVRIMRNPGYGWCFYQPYGALIGIIVKLFVGCVSLLGITVTEFWWVLPIALIGTLQVPLTYAFLKRLKASEFGAVAGAGVIAVFPLHVMQSRYSWGYEALAVTFLTLALMGLLRFLEKPTLRTGLIASLLAGFYLISHGYIMPFAVCFVALLALFSPAEKDSAWARLWAGLHLCLRGLVWVYPVVLSFALAVPLMHAMQKRTKLGFYVLDHGGGFIANIGLPLAALLLAALVAACVSRRTRSRQALLLAISGAAYLAPLFFLTPPGVTVVRGYMLVGTHLLLLAAVLVLDRLTEGLRGRAGVILALCLLPTLWGTVESVFWRNQFNNPMLVRLERGGVLPDPGSKVAGWFVREYVPRDAVVLSIHRAVEPPNLYYYFGRDRYAYYDLNLQQLNDKFNRMKDIVDVVICEAEQAQLVQADRRFEMTVIAELTRGSVTLMYARPKAKLHAPFSDPELKFTAWWYEVDWRVGTDANGQFDEDFAPKVRPW